MDRPALAEPLVVAVSVLPVTEGPAGSAEAPGLLAPHGKLSKADLAATQCGR